MRHQFLKLQKKNSTKSERVIGEILKSLRIPFRTRVRVGNREVDFLLRDLFVIELNGHPQDELKNNELIRLGYVPIHIANQDLKNNRELVTQKIICLLEQN